ncbi:hypothetical protein Ciccas_007749 [Cichlidogyrus casuarinus]|uniref:ABC transmembrane type-1 domain-containing protein n=1 Tax=Cichlidogyrus casuarinus TaxID=1844966 RepID=A0ABD2Q3C8_9PLAT
MRHLQFLVCLRASFRNVDCLSFFAYMSSSLTGLLYTTITYISALSVRELVKIEEHYAYSAVLKLILYNCIAIAGYIFLQTLSTYLWLLCHRNFQHKYTSLARQLYQDPKQYHWNASLIKQVTDVYGQSMGEFLQVAMSILAGICIIFSFDWKLSLVMFTLIPANLVLLLLDRLDQKCQNSNLHALNSTTNGAIKTLIKNSRNFAPAFHAFLKLQDFEEIFPGMVNTIFDVKAQVYYQIFKDKHVREERRIVILITGVIGLILAGLKFVEKKSRSSLRMRLRRKVAQWLQGDEFKEERIEPLLRMGSSTNLRCLRVLSTLFAAYVTSFFIDYRLALLRLVFAPVLVSSLILKVSGT